MGGKWKNFPYYDRLDGLLGTRPTGNPLLDSLIYEDEQDSDNETLISIFITIKVITKLPNSEQSYKGKVKTHNYINRQNQSTTGKLWKP